MLKKVMLVAGAILTGVISSLANAVVILQYHHVSDSTPKSTSVTPAQFAEQMQYLADNDFTVMSLTQAVEQIKLQQTGSHKQIVITFDDGYDSIIDNAAAILAKHQFPFTVFISVKPIDAGYKGMMSWRQIKTLTEQGATIANHSWGHEHLIRYLANETTVQWRQRVGQNLLKTEAEIKQQTGQSVKMLAYPYGEYNAELTSLLDELGFVGLGQQSGAAGNYSSLTALPRFPVAFDYADLSELTIKFTSLNMPVIKQNITDPQLKNGQWRPLLEVTVDTTDIDKSQMMCFVQGQGSQPAIWINDNTFSVQAKRDLPAGRKRYNCTVPSKTQTGYYWFSQAWVRPKNDGTWREE